MYVAVQIYYVIFEVEFYDDNFKVNDSLVLGFFIVLVSQPSNYKIISSRVVCYINCLYVDFNQSNCW